MKHELIHQAEAILRAWPKRLAMVPDIKPLNPQWMPAKSPHTGRRGTTGWTGQWWSWSLEHPRRLKDDTCGKLLPDRFPYKHVAAYYSFQNSLLQHDDMLTLARAYRESGQSRYARVMVKMLITGARRFLKYPLELHNDFMAGKLTADAGRYIGKEYVLKVGVGWCDTSALQGWLEVYALIKDCPGITPAQDALIRALARDIIEYNSLPNLLYLNDKYHNSLTNYYEAIARVAALWGERFTARDLISGMTYSGGDLAQLVINGPKGIGMFVANAFDRNGVYWELSPSYTGYIFGHLQHTLSLLTGYSDPKGYRPGPGVRAFYRPIKRYDPARALPELWRGVLAQTRLAMNNGLYIPTNDSNYLNAINADWLADWAKRLRSKRIRQAAQFAKKLNFQHKSAKPSWRATRHSWEGGSTLMPAAGCVTLRGPSGWLDAHLDWHRMQDYHSHKDPLNLVLCADGYLTLTDLGYHLGHPLRFIISTRTAAHNTVTVDQEDSKHHSQGRLHHYIGDGEFQLVEASVDDAYPQCDLYCRMVLLVDDRYVVDIFRVAGGETHDYTLLSRSNESRTSLSLTPSAPGTLANPDTPYQGFLDLNGDPCSPSSPYEVIHYPRFGATTDVFVVDWIQRDRSDLTQRVHHLPPPEGARVILAKVPQKDRRANDEIRADEILMVRRQGTGRLRSTFVSVMEVLSGRTSPLSAVRRLALASSDPSAVALEVRHERGTDIIIHALEHGPHHVANRSIILEGRLAVIRRAPSGATRVTMLEGRLKYGRQQIEAPGPQTARVTMVDPRAMTIHLNQPLGPSPTRLAGQFVGVRGHTGRTEHWRVASVSADGSALTLDADHSRLITLQGIIEAVENRCYFMTGVNFCVPPESGTLVRIGQVGDFRAPKYYIVDGRQTGLALRVAAGATTALESRKYYIGLDPSAKLTERDVGQWFWSSGIEIGDYVTHEPVHRVTLRP